MSSLNDYAQASASLLKVVESIDDICFPVAVGALRHIRGSGCKKKECLMALFGAAPIRNVVVVARHRQNLVRSTIGSCVQKELKSQFLNGFFCAVVEKLEEEC